MPTSSIFMVSIIGKIFISLYPAEVGFIVHGCLQNLLTLCCGLHMLIKDTGIISTHPHLFAY